MGHQKHLAEVQKSGCYPEHCMNIACMHDIVHVDYYCEISSLVLFAKQCIWTKPILYISHINFGVASFLTTVQYEKTMHKS